VSTLKAAHCGLRLGTVPQPCNSDAVKTCTRPAEASRIGDTPVRVLRQNYDGRRSHPCRNQLCQTVTVAFICQQSSGPRSGILKKMTAKKKVTAKK
jgi:hypothetical protein